MRYRGVGSAHLGKGTMEDMCADRAIRGVAQAETVAPWPSSVLDGVASSSEALADGFG